METISFNMKERLRKTRGAWHGSWAQDGLPASPKVSTSMDIRRLSESIRKDRLPHGRRAAAAAAAAAAAVAVAAVAAVAAAAGADRHRPQSLTWLNSNYSIRPRPPPQSPHLHIVVMIS